MSNRQKPSTTSRRNQRLVVRPHSSRNDRARLSRQTRHHLESLLGITNPTTSWCPWTEDLVDPSKFFSARHFAEHLLKVECLSKLEVGGSSEARTTLTWEKFHAAEARCAETNERLGQPAFGPNPFEGRSPYSAIMLARQKIARILNPRSDQFFSWDEAYESMGWGPGASTRVKRRDAHPAAKFHGRPHSTIGNASLAEAIISASPPWKAGLRSQGDPSCVDIMAGNCIVTVPKTYKVDRTIAIEPCMNLYVQKGIGAVIRNRLKAAKLDLNDQTRNQRLARIGSFSGSLATIDLSMASDTISYKLVELLLPPDWFAALELCRSPMGRLPSGEWFHYQKFSSMGNGFTFELETLIFYALALAVSELHGNKDRRISVYGDDIISPVAIATPLLETLDVCGFVPNAKKTWISGPYRESCGKHFWNGYDVTPFYVRRPVDSLRELFLYHNNVRRWYTRLGFPEEGAVVGAGIRAFGPEHWRRPRIPDGYGDGAFIGTFDEALPSCKPALNGWEGWWCRVLADVPDVSPDQPDHYGRLVSGLAGIRGGLTSFDIRSVRRPESFSGAVLSSSRTRTIKILVPQFADA